MNIGDRVTLHSYKHDKSLHRVWNTETILHEDDDLIIVANKRTRVIESDGRFWYTREPSVSFFFKKHWFNIISIIKRNQQVSFYCNLSSPILYDEEALKYIDYDLDIKVSSDYNYHVLDMNEYNRNQEKMDYPDKVKQIIFSEMTFLKEMIESKDFPFNKASVIEWYTKFLSIEGEM